MSVIQKLSSKQFLLATMLVAYLLRLILVVGEGQFHFTDEGRYRNATGAVEMIVQGDIGGALNLLLEFRPHQGFATASLFPAVLHRVAYAIAPSSDLAWDDYWYSRYSDFRFSSLFFAIPSVLAIGMIYLVARQAGARETEALLGAFFLAAANTLFMYSRHFLPYDFSLLLGLTTIWLVLKRRRASAKYSIAIGLAAFLTFWIYNGYLTLSILIALVYCLYLAPNPKTAIRRALGMFAGSMIIFVPLYIYNFVVLDIDMISQLREFSATVNHGDYSEGLVLPFLYFIHAETGVAFVWIMGILLAARRLRRSYSANDRQRALLWFVSLFTLYLLLSVSSNVLQLFVIYGRVARSLVPFIVLLCAFAYAPVLRRFGWWSGASFVVIMSVFALINFVPLIQQRQYRTLQRHVYSNYKGVSYESTFGPTSNPYGFRGIYLPKVRYKLINAGVWYPKTERFYRPEGKILLEVPHPINNWAWHYDRDDAEVAGNLAPRTDHDVAN